MCNYHTELDFEMVGIEHAICSKPISRALPHFSITQHGSDSQSYDSIGDGWYSSYVSEHDLYRRNDLIKGKNKDKKIYIYISLNYAQVGEKVHRTKSSYRISPSSIIQTTVLLKKVRTQRLLFFPLYPKVCEPFLLARSPF